MQRLALNLKQAQPLVVRFASAKKVPWLLFLWTATRPPAPGGGASPGMGHWYLRHHCSAKRSNPWATRWCLDRHRLQGGLTITMRGGRASPSSQAAPVL